MKFKVGGIAIFKDEEWLDKNAEKVQDLYYRYGENKRIFDFPMPSI